MKAFVKKIMICIYRILNVLLPKSSRIVVFSSSNGKNTGGNPRAIYEYAAASSENGDQKTGKYWFVWFLTDELLRKHPEKAEKLKYVNEKKSEASKTADARTAHCKIVRYGHPAYYWYMARAGIWIFDSRQEPYISKRPGVRYLQTWHGTPLKKLGLDIDEMNMSGENRNIEEYREAFRREAAQWDYLIAQNSFSAETFRRCFDFHGEMLKTGYPRNDELVRAAKADTKENSKENVPGDRQNEFKRDAKAGTTSSKRVLLYAPTWRDDKYLNGGWYAYSSPLDFNKLYEMLGDGFRIIIKPHYLVKIKDGDLPKELIDKGFLKVCSQSDEINGLYLQAAGLITDYSSAMFDYNLLGRPMFFYAYDIEDYAEKLRGFYFDFVKEAPGPICRTTEELGNSVQEAFDRDNRKERYGERIRKFSEKYNTYDDGNAAKKAWNMVVKASR